MSALIKRRTVGQGSGDGEFVVESRVARSRKRAGPLSPEDEARQMLEQAGAEAARLVAQAQGEAESVRMAAYREGRAEAMAELEVSRCELAQHATQIDEDARSQAAKYWRSIEPDVLRLSVEIARKIVRREVEQNDEFLLDAIKAGLHQLSSRHELKIRVHSSDAVFVREHKDELATSFDGISAVEVIEDRRVSRGGWMVESQDGHMDGRIDSQLKEVERTLLEAAINDRA